MKMKQKGSGVVILLVVLAVFVLGLIAVVGTYVAHYNMGVRYETSIVATYDNNKNVLSNYTTKIKEMIQLPDAYRDDLQKVIEATFQGRYGADGSKATFQWIQEQNLNLDPGMYQNVQRSIEAGRNEFQTNQTALLDLKRSYDVQLKSFWSGLWLGFAGYPKINLAKYDIIILDEVNQKFDSKKDEVIKLR